MNPEAPDDYVAEDIARRIKTGRNVVVIQPERNLTVPVEVEIHDAEPEYNPDEWDHIVEASLYLPSGHLSIEECTSSGFTDFEVSPGWYRVRSFHGGFDTLDEWANRGGDYYKIVLWPAPPADIVVVKQWLGPNLD